ncbi:MAG TPA: isoprenylcysteine carboxylmethyltransferase family protein [Phycisphaerae bacterium]|nr:isoprenylcysteine carboxylmethyltransferase family protein [Phycisphaerae bacterium]
MDYAIAAIIACCLSIYWFWVFVKLIKVGRQIGKDPNAMPRERVGQLMRVLWYPCIAVLLAALWIAAAIPDSRLAHWPEPARLLVTRLWTAGTLGHWSWAAMGPALLLAVACTVFTFVCWHRMGRSWRIGIDPGEKLAIVSTGPYRLVRHPIYALRMVINICACILVPTPLVIAAAAIDFILLQIEARREERYMESKHGAEYAKYKNSVGRFVPRVLIV